MVELLGYKKKDVARATHVPLSSVRYDAKMPDELRVRIIEWAVAINLVASFFGGKDRDASKTQEKTLLWFQVPNRFLGGISPRDMIRVGRFRKLLKYIHTALSENSR